MENAFVLDPRDVGSQRLFTEAQMEVKKSHFVYGTHGPPALFIRPATESLTESISYILDPSPEDLDDDDSEPPPLEDIDPDEDAKALVVKSKPSVVKNSRLPPSSITTSTPSTKALVKNDKVSVKDTIKIPQKSIRKPVVPVLACPPDRHFNGISPEAENLVEVDELLLKLFLAAHARTSLALRARQLADTRELLLHHYLMVGSEWVTANFDSVAGRNEITRNIMVKMKNMFSPSVLAGYGLEAWTTASGNVLQMLVSSLFVSSFSSPLARK